METKTSDIQKLRDATGAGVMDCQKALQDAKGNFDVALALIRERGFTKAEKRAGRETGAGLVHSYVHGERIGVLLEMRAETDFVVRSEPFRHLAHEIAMQIAAGAPENVDSLLNQPYIKDERIAVRDILNEVIAKVGENIRINRFYRIEI